MMESRHMLELAHTPTRMVRNMRPLLFDGEVLYCSRFSTIYATSDLGRSFSRVASLQVSGWKGVCGRWSKLARRVLRTDVYRMRCLANGNQLFVFQGGIFTRRAGSDAALKTFAVTRGSRPISLDAKPDGLAVFGEYFSNPLREPVHIYGSRDGGLTWGVVYTFPAGSIRHVHGISYDPWEDCFWICTGDYHDECQLLRAAADFQDVHVVRQGGQHNRFYSILVQSQRLVMATDTPLEENYVCTYDKATGRFDKVQPIENSSFYCCEAGGRIFVSTVAEPSPCNDSQAVYVWMNEGKNAASWRRIMTLEVDALERLGRLPKVPKGLFQYPRVFFPDGENRSNTLVCHFNGLRGRSNAMVCYDTQQWDAGQDSERVSPVAA